MREVFFVWMESYCIRKPRWTLWLNIRNHAIKNILLIRVHAFHVVIVAGHKKHAMWQLSKDMCWSFILSSTSAIGTALKRNQHLRLLKEHSWCLAWSRWSIMILLMPYSPKYTYYHSGCLWNVEYLFLATCSLTTLQHFFPLTDSITFFYINIFNNHYY